jgi:hypothetical protein
MRWVDHVARIGEGKNVYKVLMGKPDGRRQLERQIVDGRMGLEWTLGGLVVGGFEVDSPGSGWGLLAGCCECGDENCVSNATDLVVGKIGTNEWFVVNWFRTGPMARLVYR